MMWRPHALRSLWYLALVLLLLFVPLSRRVAAAPEVQPLVVVEGLAVSVSVTDLQPHDVVQLWRGGKNCTDGASAHVLDSQEVPGEGSSVVFHLCALCCGSGYIDVCLLKRRQNSNPNETVWEEYSYERLNVITAMGIRHAPTTHALANGNEWPSTADFYLGLVEPDGTGAAPGFCLSEECDGEEETGGDAESLTYVAGLLNRSYLVVSNTTKCPALQGTSSADLVAYAPITVTRTQGGWLALASIFTTSSSLAWAIGLYNTYVMPKESADSESCMGLSQACTSAGVTAAIPTFALQTISPFRNATAVLANITSIVSLSETTRSVASSTHRPQYYVMVPAGSPCDRSPIPEDLILVQGKFQSSGSDTDALLTQPFRLQPSDDAESGEALIWMCVGSEEHSESTMYFAHALSSIFVVAKTTTLFTKEVNLFYATPPRSLLEDSYAFLSASSQCQGGITYNVTLTGDTVDASLLDAPVGSYTLCYATDGGKESSGSSPRVLEVYNPYQCSWPETVYVDEPFFVNVTEGDLKPAVVVSVFLLPEDVACESITYIETGGPARDEVLGWFNATATENSDEEPFVSLNITISSEAHKAVRLCVQSQDKTRNISVVLFEDPLPQPIIMLPTSMIKGREQNIQSLSRSTGYAMLSRTENCSDPLQRNASTISPIQPIIKGIVTLYAPLCTMEDTAYYCEADGDSEKHLQWSPVAKEMRLLSLYNCEEQVRVNILDHSVDPGTPIDSFGLTEGFAQKPYLSCSNTCNSTGPNDAMMEVEKRGFVPSVAQHLEYYVCVTSMDNTLNFTTSSPTVKIRNYQLDPRSAVANATEEVTLAPPTLYPSGSFWSKTRSCAHTEDWDAAEIAAGKGDLLLEVSAAKTGLFFLCTDRVNDMESICSDSESASLATEAAKVPVPIEVILVVAPPTFIAMTPPVVDSLVCVSLSVYYDLYSLVPDEDMTSTAYANYRPYYQTANRDLFLRQIPSGGSYPVEFCRAGPGEASSEYSSTANAKSSIYNHFEACFNTTGLETNTSYVICAGTPVGYFPVPDATIALETPTVQPSELVSGSTSVLDMPIFPNTTFRLVYASAAPSRQSDEVYPMLLSTGSTATLETTKAADVTGCDSWSTSLPMFQTSALGTAVVEISQRLGDGSTSLLPAGTYVFCRKLDDHWLPEMPVEIFAPSYFSVFPTAVVSAVSTPLLLEQDLSVSDLLPGVHTSEDCAAEPLNSTQATWQVYSDSGDAAKKWIQLNVSDDTHPAVYVCATAPINGTQLAIPKSGLSIMRSPAQYFDTFSACSEFNIYFTDNVPDTMEPSANLALSPGPCCTSSVAADTLAAGSILIEGLHVGPGFRTFLVNDTTVAAMNKMGETIHVCFADANMSCITAGWIAPSSVSLCQTNIGYLTVSSKSERADFFENRLYFSSMTWVIIICSCAFVVFLAVLTVLVAICCRRAIVKRKKIEKGEIVRGKEAVLDRSGTVSPGASPSCRSPVGGAETEPSPLTLTEIFVLSAEEIKWRLSELLQEDHLHSRHVLSDAAALQLLTAFTGNRPQDISDAESGGSPEDGAEEVPVFSEKAAQTSASFESAMIDDGEPEEEAVDLSDPLAVVIQQEHLARQELFHTEDESLRHMVETSYSEWRQATGHEAETLAVTLKLFGADGGLKSGTTNGFSSSALTSVTSRRGSRVRVAVAAQESEHGAGQAGGVVGSPVSDHCLVLHNEAAADPMEATPWQPETTGLEKAERGSRRRIFREEDEALRTVMEGAYLQWRASMGVEGATLQDVLQHDTYWEDAPEQLEDVHERVLHHLVEEEGSAPPEDTARHSFLFRIGTETVETSPLLSLPLSPPLPRDSSVSAERHVFGEPRAEAIPHVYGNEAADTVVLPYTDSRGWSPASAMGSPSQTPHRSMLAAPALSETAEEEARLKP